MTGGSWITKPKWQITAGILIGLCILASGVVSQLGIQSERDHRQDEAVAESLKRDTEIKNESVRITCGILLGFERLTPQIALTGQEDQATHDRIAKSNADRLAARAILRGAMPADIVAECPSEGG